MAEMDDQIDSFDNNYEMQRQFVAENSKIATKNVVSKG